MDELERLKKEFDAQIETQLNFAAYEMERKLYAFGFLAGQPAYENPSAALWEWILKNFEPKKWNPLEEAKERERQASP